MKHESGLFYQNDFTKNGYDVIAKEQDLQRNDNGHRDSGEVLEKPLSDSTYLITGRIVR